MGTEAQLAPSPIHNQADPVLIFKILQLTTALIENVYLFEQQEIWSFEFVQWPSRTIGHGTKVPSVCGIRKPEDQWSCKRSPETRDIYMNLLD